MRGALSRSPQLELLEQLHCALKLAHDFDMLGADALAGSACYAAVSVYFYNHFLPPEWY